MDSSRNGGTEAGATRAMLEAAYLRAGEAYRQKDAAALMNMVTDDFTQLMPDGQIISRNKVEPMMRDWFATTDEVTGYEIRIDDLADDGADAVATITELVTTRFHSPDGAPHQRTQRNSARTTWTRTPGGWRIRRSEYLAGKMLVDGKEA